MRQRLSSEQLRHAVLTWDLAERLRLIDHGPGIHLEEFATLDGTPVFCVIVATLESAAELATLVHNFANGPGDYVPAPPVGTN